MSVLIWVQTVCKCYQQKTKDYTSKERVKGDFSTYVIRTKISCAGSYKVTDLLDMNICDRDKYGSDVSQTVGD